MSDHKTYLIEQSEQIVDIQLELEAARNADDRATCEELFAKLEQIGDDLVGLNTKLDSDDLAFSNFMLGSVCALMGLWTHAENAYDLALSHWPEHNGLLNEMAECQFELGNFDKAAHFLERSLKTGGHTPILIHDLAIAQAWSGATSEARITLINGLARFPDDNTLKQALHEIDSHP